MKNKLPILLVEDDEIDALTVRRALKMIQLTNPLIHRENGEEALDYLKAGNKRPCIILLDLNMPRMGGLEFLEVIKGTEQFRSIPVIVLTTSAEDEDRLQSFNYSVAGYMVKPVDYESFVHMMRAINRYWTLSETPY